jgi:catechol 2,3-dioxygenase-like lactoylglutathione lyase family enzyme
MATKLESVALTVWTNDVPETIAFYKKLGFQNQNEHFYADVGYLVLGTLYLTIRLANDHHPVGSAQYELVVGAAKALREELVGAGIEVAEDSEFGHGSQRSFAVRDPNGIQLRFQGFNW